MMQIGEYVMECFKCGKTIDNNSTYCNYCGSKQEITIEKTEDEMIKKIQNLISITGSIFNSSGVEQCKQWIKEFSFEILYDSISTSIAQYLVESESGGYTEDSVNEVFNKIGGIAKNKHTEMTRPYVSDVRRITNYLKKVFYINYYELNDLSADLNNLLYYFYTTNQYDNKVEDILSMIRGSKTKTDFFDKIEALKSMYNIE